MNIEQWLDTELGKDIWNNKYRHKNETLDEWFVRVSGGNKEVEQLMKERKFLFGGRALTNRGTGNNASYSNCYSHGYMPDSLDGIMSLNKNLAMTYKSQGGQGVSLSKVRPKGTTVGNGNFVSDGIFPFMEIANTTTASVSQGGSRKGALMMSLSCEHKEILDFITIKSNEGKIEKANLSVEVTDEFMEAVEKYYNDDEVVEVEYTKIYGEHTVVYSLKPIEVYKAMMTQAYDWAEPGIIYTKRFRNYNLMQFIKAYEIVTGNPCGEQPLPKHGACCLASINAGEFVTDDNKFDTYGFINAVQVAIVGLNELLDEGLELHALQEQRDMARWYRNIGLGFMGIGDLFIKLKMKYGSKESKELLDELARLMFKVAVEESSRLATIDGSFPKYDKKVFDSDIIKDHFTIEEIERLKSQGLRNCSLLSIAPTGSIGTMLDITTGIEPAFAWSYQRKTESLHKNQDVMYTVWTGIARKYMEEHNTDTLPNYFVSSGDIPWKDRIDIQAVAQNHIDTAISSTVNLPNDISMEEIEQLYLYAWKQGLKGVTIFRDGCKRGAILSTSTTIADSTMGLEELPWGTTIAPTDDMIGRKRKIMSGCGAIHVQAWFDPIDGRCMEVFLSKGSTGGCNSFMTGLSRMTSLALRTGANFETIIDQLGSSPTCPSYAVRSAVKKDTSKGNNCPTALGNALKEMQSEVFLTLGVTEDDVYESPKQEKLVSHDKKSKVIESAKCPLCGEPLRFEGGCQSCISCGFSKCE